MIKTRFISLFVIPLLFSNICLAKDKIIAKYNDKNVMKSEITQRFKDSSGKLPDNKNSFDDYDNKVKEQLIAAFIQEQLLIEAAKNAKVDQDPAYKQQLDNLINQFKIKTYLENYTNKKLTPLMVRNAYNQYVKSLKNNDEIKVSHILCKTEAEANKIASEIKANKISFEDAVKKYSTDTASKAKNGSLGFIHAGQTIPEFENAAYNLKNGATSSPVKTNFGWHIIKRFESRKRKIPSFNAIKQNIEHQIKMSLVQQHLAEITKNAKIEILPKK